MVPGSRLILPLFGAKQISSVSQVQHAEKKPHDTMCEERAWQTRTAERKKSATAQDKKPAEQSDPARHEEPCGVNRAAVKDDPAQGKAEQANGAGGLFLRGTQIEQGDRRANQPGRKRRQQRLQHAPGGRRPKRFGVPQSLAAKQKETAGDGQHGDGQPEADKGARGLNVGKPANHGSQCSQAAGQQHQRGERPAVNRGTFHQSPDHPQVVRRPIRFHGVTLYYKVTKVKPDLAGKCPGRGEFKNGSRRRKKADFGGKNTSASSPRRLRFLRRFLNSPCGRTDLRISSSGYRLAILQVARNSQLRPETKQ